MAFIDRTGCPARTDRNGIVRHGTRNAYNKYGCRCPDACEMARLYRKRHREHRLEPALVDVTGTMRRLQALAVAGYSCPDLAETLGMNFRILNCIRRGVYPKTPRRVAAKIDALYQQLHMIPAPDNPHTRQVQKHARKQGWLPAFAWDEDIDDPNAVPNIDGRPPIRKEKAEVWAPRDVWLAVIDGEPPSARERRTTRNARPRPEHMTSLREAAVVFLTEIAGMDSAAIAQHLRVTERAVQRYRALARAAGWDVRRDDRQPQYRLVDLHQAAVPPHSRSHPISGSRTPGTEAPKEAA